MAMAIIYNITQHFGISQQAFAILRIILKMIFVAVILHGFPVYR